MERYSRQVTAGTGKVRAAQMVDSAPLLQAGQFDALKERLARDGYLLLQKFLPAGKLSEVFHFFTTTCTIHVLVSTTSVSRWFSSCAGTCVFTG